MGAYRNKNTIKYLVAVTVLIIAIICMVVRIVGQIGVAAKEQRAPAIDNKIVLLTGEVSESALYNHKVQAPTLPLTMQLPSSMEENNGVLSMSYGVADVVIAEYPKEDMEKVLYQTLPNHIKMPVIGYMPKYTAYECVSSTMDSATIAYYAYSVETKVSIRKSTNYNVAYCITADGYENALYIVVSVSSVEDWQRAKTILDEFLQGIRIIEPEQRKEVQDSLTGDNDFTDVEDSQEESSVVPIAEEKKTEEPAYKSISLQYESQMDMEDGVFWMQWSGQAEPEEIHVYRPDGEECPYMKEYSYAGNYVFRIEKSAPGTYIVEGKTKEVLQNVIMSVNSEEGYRSLNYLNEDEDVIPRDYD